MDIQTGCLFLLWADVHTLCFTQWLSWTVQSLYTSTVENQAPGWPQERLGEWADAGKWDTSNITCMNRTDQSHAPKLVTDRQAQAQARKKWLIGLSAHAGAKNRDDNKFCMSVYFVMEYKTYDGAFVFGVIFDTHCWWIFLILNSDRSWLIKFLSLKINTQNKIHPKIQAICPLIPYNENISGNLAERVSIVHIFWHFEKCSSDHFDKCVMKFQ
jgi:hypothetical protein